MRLYKRGRIWWTWIYSEGARVAVSTGCHDKRAAEARAAEIERDAADPARARARDATLADALVALLDDRAERARVRKGSEATTQFYREKAGVLLRVFGEGVRLAEITAERVDAYIAQRRRELSYAGKPAVLAQGRRKARPAVPPRRVSEHTISKELVTLRAALRLARRAGLYLEDPGAVLPVGFGSQYRPRERVLTLPEFEALIAELDVTLAPLVAYAVATGAERSALDRARRDDVRDGAARVRGSKSAARDRVVPLVTTWQRDLAAFALSHAPARADGLLFGPVPANSQRSLARACVRAGIERVCLHDLRRTYATWLRSDGAPVELLAPALGHRTTTMVQTVYGRLSPQQLRERLTAAIAAAGCSTIVATPGSTEAPVAPEALDTDEIGEGNQAPRGGSSGDRTLDLRIKSPRLRMRTPLRSQPKQPLLPAGVAGLKQRAKGRS